MQFDYKGLNAQLLMIAGSVLAEWFPNGRRRGREWITGDLHDNPGRSLSINMESGAWADFADGNCQDRGGDLISLFSKINKIDNYEAALQLIKKYGLSSYAVVPEKPWQLATSDDIQPAPNDAPEPKPSSAVSGKWIYHVADGRRAFYVFRHDDADGDGNVFKRYSQWSYSASEGKFVGKAFPAPRPLYNLTKLLANPEARVLVVEGEKAADAAQTIIGDRAVVVTWAGGAKAVSKADWKPLKGRTVTIWPDNDEPGIKAARDVSERLHAIGSHVRIIDTSDIKEEGWDAADALREGWDYYKLSEWAKEHAAIVKVEATLKVDDGSVAAAPHAIERWMKMGLQLNSRGMPMSNMTNVQRILSGCGDMIPDMWYDTFARRRMINWGDGKVPFTDEDARKIQTILQSEAIGLNTVGKDTVFDGIYAYTEARKRNSVVDEISSWTYDGKPRIDTFFQDVGGVYDSEYARAVSRNFWLSMMMRIIRPGCQVDSMFIIEGKQGIGKTQLLRKIGREYYVELGFNRFSKQEMAVTMQGHFIAELGELTQFRKADVAELKSWITCNVDEFRRAYDREASVMPRQCILVGTTNQDQYLVDTTGARRFFPVTMTKAVNLEYVEEFRQQLFAEAYARCLKNEKWWDFPSEEAASEQEDRRVQDEYENVLRDWLISKRSSKITVWEVGEHLGFSKKDLDKPLQFRITDVLKASGFVRKHSKRGSHWVYDHGEDKDVEF